MKYYGLILSFFLCCKTIVFAGVSCNDIKNNFLALELKLQNSCEKIQADGSCCDIDEGLSEEEKKKGDFNPQCISKRDLESKYNQKMAELVIAEGFASMALAIEANHNALNDLTQKQIDKASEKVNQLEKSLFIADLFHLAMFDNKDNTGTENTGNEDIIFNDYSSAADLKNYINTKCESAQFSNMRFCAKVKQENESPNYQAFLDTLKGFLDLDNRTHAQSLGRKERFEKYKNSLKINLNNQTLTPNEFLNSDHYKNVLDLKNKLVAYADAPTENKASDILNLSKIIEPISVNFDIKDDPSVHTANYLKEHFNKPLNQLNLPSLIIDGNFKEYFENTKKKVDIDVNMHEKAFLEKISNSSDHGCKTLSCLETYCNNVGEDAVGICPEYRSLRDHKNVSETLASAENCMLPSKKTEEKKSCLEKLAPKGSSIATLKAELKRLEELRKRQDSVSPFKELNLEKSMALHALSSHSCQDLFEKYTIEGIHNTDCEKSLELTSDYDAYTLIVDGELLSISLNNNQIQDTLKKLGHDSDMAKLESEFTEYCKTDRADARQICSFYNDKKSFAVAMKKDQTKRERAAKKRAQRIASLKEEEPSYWKSGTKSFIKGFVNNSAPLIQSFFALQAQETQTANQLNAISSYNTAYMNSLNAYLNSNDPNNSQFFASNGQQNLGSDFQSLSTFQNSNQSYAFGDPNNPFKYSFNIPNPVLTSSLIQTTYINKNRWAPDSLSVFFLAAE